MCAHMTVRNHNACHTYRQSIIPTSICHLKEYYIQPIVSCTTMFKPLFTSPEIYTKDPDPLRSWASLVSRQLDLQNNTTENISHHAKEEEERGGGRFVISDSQAEPDTLTLSSLKF